MEEMANLQLRQLDANSILTAHFANGIIYEDHPFDEVRMDLVIKKTSSHPNSVDFVFDLSSKIDGIQTPLDISEYLPGVVEGKEPPIFDNLEGSMDFSDFTQMFEVLCEAASVETSEVFRESYLPFLEDMWSLYHELEGTSQFLVIGLVVFEDCRSLVFDVCSPGVSESKILYSTTLFFHDEVFEPELPELEADPS